MLKSVINSDLLKIVKKPWNKDWVQDKGRGFMKIKDVEKIAAEHWKWIEGFLETFPDEQMYGMAMTEYLYKTAFVHGYKHALQLNSRGQDDVLRDLSEDGLLIGDGFGTIWSNNCPSCQKPTIQVLRPGVAVCSKCNRIV